MNVFKRRKNWLTRASESLPVSGMMLAGLSAGLALAGLARWRSSRRERFTGQVVVITGGSRGLGLEMARQLADEGARLALLARNQPELESARQELVDKTDVMVIPCDVGVRLEIESAIDQVLAQYGRIDMLINNAGIIQVGPFEQMQLADFENAMDVHFWGPLYAILAVVPVMRRQRGGRIVNISSIGGEVAVPHLAPYNASKFALTGLSDALRAELAKDNITVTTVTPGLMRTGSYYHANFKGQNRKEFAWFSLMSATPLTAMSSRRAARQVINAARAGSPKRTLTLQARLLEMTDYVFPGLIAWIAKLAASRMPRPAGDQGYELRTGFESRSKLAPKWATQMGDRAAEKNNEMMAEQI
jgi:NAD(P)-dependent dehydrogenase (short-subunit alcohol dehydrogenase family)